MDRMEFLSECYDFLEFHNDSLCNVGPLILERCGVEFST